MPLLATDSESIRSEGGLLPPDLLRRILNPKERLAGTRPEDYGLPQSERLTEVITPAWNRLRKHWAELRASLAHLPVGDPGTGITNDKWTLPLLRELGFGLLPVSAGPDVGGRPYAINRFFGRVPIHLVGSGVNLDRRAAGVRGAAAANPHGLVQDFLNRSSGSLWGLVTNGLRFRILRNNQALSRQSFLEFDLEVMFTGELYADFVLLWLISHATRFAPRDVGNPETCWLELWTKEAEKQGTRVLGDLRLGVQRALQLLGEGFTAHPSNTVLRDQLRSGTLRLTAFHGQLLRLVYRLIFLFVAEDRTIDGLPLLHTLDDSVSGKLARSNYATYYSTARLRSLASQIKGSRHSDLWTQFQLLGQALSGDATSESVRKRLALPALGSYLWDRSATDALNECALTNFDLLEALRHLAFTRQGRALRSVDFKNLGAEELGGIYESLLGLTPQISSDGARFFFAEFAGNERKTSGSYYTQDSLVQCLLDSTLDPVVQQVLEGKKGPDAERAILSLKICDPAVGSGHFLLGAAHRLARHLSMVRAFAEGESQPSVFDYQRALRDVIGRCLYGVDLNPMAAELCRVSLWLESLEPGKPLSFLDHHIRVGNSLIGATPALIVAGLPDGAFRPVSGDDKDACTTLKKRNSAELRAIGPLFAQEDSDIQAALQHAAADLELLPDTRPEDVRAKELAFRQHEQTQQYLHKKHIADTWCAAFVIPKLSGTSAGRNNPSGITQRHLNDLARGTPLPPELALSVARLTAQYRFFHWHLAFPEVFSNGGFDVVIGNPPWERTAFEAVPFFESRIPDIAAAETTAKRQALIEALAQTEPVIWEEYQTILNTAEASDSFYHNAGRFPFSASGRTNTFALFTESALYYCADKGRVGLVIPSALATDTPYAAFWSDILARRTVVSMYDFENRGRFFPIHDSYKFSLFTFCNVRLAQPSRFGFFLSDPSDITDPTKVFFLSQSAVAMMNPITKLMPVSRSSEDFLLLVSLHGTGVLLKDLATPWVGLTSSATSVKWRFNVDEEDVPTDHSVMYEAKCIHQFNHRFATYRNTTRQQKLDGEPIAFIQNDDPNAEIVGRYDIPSALWTQHLSIRQRYVSAALGYRDVARSTDERTMIATVVPFAGFMQPLNGISCTSPTDALLLAACLNSFALDFCCRQKTPGIHVNVTTCKQLPMAITSDSLKALDQCLSGDAARRQLS